VVASIFINPTQFGPNEDLAKYPRDMPHDLALLDAVGVDLVWTPSVEVMYPPGFQTWVDVEQLTRPLEGGLRPGHFRGVTTIVTKLFHGVSPDKAFFGQKDAQQAAVIRRMTRDLDLPIDIVICPTLREEDGLAMSSRNVYLNPQERQAATVLFRALSVAKSAFDDGERSAEKCADYDTLVELETVKAKSLLSMAVMLGKTRLIDNFVIDPRPGLHSPGAGR
jgi:pantoate--beta-alanine ligase